MKAWQKKWMIGSCVAIVAVLGTVLLAIAWWLPTDEELARRLTAEANGRLDVKLSIGSVQWSLLPTPAITVHDVRTQQTQPVVIHTLRAYPSLRMLLRGKLVFERISVDGATVPRNSLHALRAKPGTAKLFGDDGVPLGRLEFRQLTWISYSGIAVVYEGEIDFDPHWRPRHAELRRPGITPPFTLTVTREAQADSWQTHIFVGGGTAHGDVILKTAEDGVMQLSGQLAPRDVEVASALGTFNRRSPVAGKAVGRTTLVAAGRTLGQLTRSLHTRTQFSVDPATVLRFDLDKAIRTRGKEHDGQTPLQELTGQMDTQNGDEGMRVTLTEIRAHAGTFTATGKATVYHGQIQASGNLDWIEGAIGVPFTLSGPVQKPKISVPPGFFAGAAIGTAVFPGVGTVIGARIGGALGKVFKDGAQQPAPAKNGELR
ncbi:MAG: hypothetical protein V4858_21915 [Pseudomonadota bacterium]